MKKQKHKVTAEVQKLLIDRAKGLPVMYKKDAAGKPLYKLGAVDGSEVDKDKHGNPGVPGVKYSGMVLQYENHYERLLRAYQSGGIVAVEEYEIGVNQEHAIRNRYVAAAAADKKYKNQPFLGGLIRFMERFRLKRR